MTQDGDFETPGSRFCTVVAELERVSAALSEDELRQLVDAIMTCNRVFFAGGGRSGLVARAIAMRMMHIGLTVHVVGETASPGVQQGDLLLAFTASGRGAGLAAQAEGAKDAGATLAVVVANESSAIAKSADVVVKVPAGYGGVESVQHAGSLFEQACLLLGDSVAARVQAIRGVSNDEMSSRHFNLY